MRKPVDGAAPVGDPKTPDAAPAPAAPALEGVEAPKKRLVNMTGRRKAVTTPPLPVKQDLAGEVARARASVVAGGSATKSDPMARVRKMTNEELGRCVEGMRKGTVKDRDLQLAVASEVAARTDWGKENPEAVSLMRERISDKKLKLEDVDPRGDATPEQVIQRLAEHSQLEFEDTVARLAQATRIPDGPRGSARIVHVDGTLNTKSYEKLPSDLKSKMPPTVWRDLDQDARTTLMSTYSRLKGWGAWDEVKMVKRELNPTEAHAHVGGAEFEVAGNTGGVVFEAKDAKAFKLALLQTGHFGVDKGVVGALHQGQASTREWTDDPGSLHVSIGPGNDFDTHMDKFSPVKQPSRGETQIEPEKGFDHHRNEVWPEMIRKATGLPGVMVDAELRPKRDGGLPEVHGTVGLEWRGPVSSRRKTVNRQELERVHRPRTGGEPGPDGVMADVLKGLDLSKVRIPRPKGEPEPIDAQTLAEDLAAKMLSAARTGKDPIELTLPEYAHQPKLQAAVTKELQALATQVRASLEKALDRADPTQREAYDPSAVKSLKVNYGPKTQGARVELE
jgi:hypothetical protein